MARVASVDSFVRRTTGLLEALVGRGAAAAAGRPASSAGPTQDSTRLSVQHETGWAETLWGMRPTVSGAAQRAERAGTGRREYNFIRSDMEDEDFRHGCSTNGASNGTVLPQRRRPAAGVRQRTYPNLGLPPASQVSSDCLSWVESSTFQAFSGGVIIINALVTGLETDIVTPLWDYCETAFLTFFVVELFCRMLRCGLCHYFFHPEESMWNVLDFSIVASGAAEQWLVPAVVHWFPMSAQEESMSAYIFVVRLLRMVRIIRLARLFRIVRPLHLMAQGVVEALKGMVWVLLFMAMTLYAVAMTCTMLIGEGYIIPEALRHDVEVEKIRVMFSSVPESMFSLFGSMTSWSLNTFMPLYAEIPLLRPALVLFYIFSVWALLAVMTGVVSENMIAIRQQAVAQDEEREEMRKIMITTTLLEMFTEADTNGDGSLASAEFDAMLRVPALAKKLSQNTSMKVQDLRQLYDWLDPDASGMITIHEFMEGFRWLMAPMNAKRLVKLKERFAGDLRKLETSVAAAIESRVREVQKLIDTPLRKVHAITEQMQSVDHQYSEIRTTMRDHLLAMPTQEEIDSVGSRLMAKLAGVHAQLDALEQTMRPS